MPVIPGHPGQDVLDLLADVMRDRHRPLYDAGVKVGVVMLANPKEGQPALMGHGYPAYAKIKVVGLIDRLTKQFDAELHIDATRWEDELTHRQRVALFDHELSHLELADYAYFAVKDGDGEPTGEQEIRFKRDDLDRPKLRLVKGDANGGDGFRAVIERNGADALEFLNAKNFAEFAERAREDGTRPIILRTGT